MTPWTKVSTVQVTDSNSRFLQLIRGAASLGFIAVAVFLIYSSRPTADEYLLAPVVDGYYVDQPKVPLFDNSENRFVGYFKGAHAIVQLGWDAWPNALTFQMGSGILVNYAGPLGTVVQGLIFVCLWVWSLRLLVRKLAPRQSGGIELQFVSMTALGAMAAMSVGNFNTTRMPFGLYPFLGIRFGLYVVHSLLLVALIVQMLAVERQETDRKSRTRSLFLWTVTFVGFASLWYVFYLLVFILLRGVNQLLHRRSVWLYAELLMVTAATTFVFYEGLGGVRNRTVARSAGGTEIVHNFVRDVVLNTSSRLYSYELWSTVVGRHSLVAWMVGLMAMICIPYRRTAENEIHRTLVRISLSAIPALPLLFVFQEYVTYEAWWHRSTPIMLSSVSFMIFGASCAKLVLLKLPEQRRGLVVGVVVTGLFALCTSSLSDAALSVNRFRNSWDAGNVLGLGSPVENNADYNVINAFRVSPYRNLKWDVQTRMLESIPTSMTTVEVNSVSDLPNHQLSCYTEVELKSSPFDTELGGEVDFKFVLSDDMVKKTMRVVGVVDQWGTRWEDASKKSTLTGRAAVPGRVRVIYFGPDCAAVEPIEQLALRFTPEIRKTKSTHDQYVIKSRE